jgi:hypothetical protein
MKNPLIQYSPSIGLSMFIPLEDKIISSSSEFHQIPSPLRVYFLCQCRSIAPHSCRRGRNFSTQWSSAKFMRSLGVRPALTKYVRLDGLNVDTTKMLETKLDSEENPSSIQSLKWNTENPILPLRMFFSETSSSPHWDSQYSKCRT